MNRFVLLTGTLALAASSLLAQDTEGGAVYEKDVEFLLTELPKQAGRFFELKKIDWDQVSRQFRDEVKAVRSDEDHLKLGAGKVSAAELRNIRKLLNELEH